LRRGRGSFGGLGDATDAHGRCFDDFGRGRDGGSLLGPCGLRGLHGFGRLGGFGGLFGLHLATKSVGVGSTSDSVRLGVLDRRRGARSTYAKFLGERE